MLRTSFQSWLVLLLMAMNSWGQIPSSIETFDPVNEESEIIANLAHFDKDRALYVNPIIDAMESLWDTEEARMEIALTDDQFEQLKDLLEARAELAVNMEAKGRSESEQSDVLLAQALKDTKAVLLPHQYKQLERLAVRHAVNSIGVDRLFTTKWFQSYVGLSADEGEKIYAATKSEKEQLEKLISKLRAEFLTKVAQAVRDSETAVLDQLGSRHRSTLRSLFGHDRDVLSGSSDIIELLSQHRVDLSITSAIYLAIIVTNENEKAKNEIKLTENQSKNLSKALDSVVNEWSSKLQKATNDDEKQEIRRKIVAMTIKSARNVCTPEQFKMIERLATRYALNQLGIGKIFSANWFLDYINMSQDEGEDAQKIGMREQEKLENTIAILKTEFRKKVNLAEVEMTKNVILHLQPKQRQIVSDLFAQE